ncbi:MAG: beta-galactosidase, partial [Spirochaetota bacterium]
MIGVDYYPEHWDFSRIEKDMNIMKKHGIEIIRIGEFMWDKLEPEEAHYDFSILDKVFEIAGKKDIKIILGTPSAVAPVWLMTKYKEEIFQKDYTGYVKNLIGGRRHYCYNSKIYSEYVARIVKKLAGKYGDKDNLYAWQIDNEFGGEDTAYCYCENCDRAFTEYLKYIYHSLDNLNKAWGMDFWSNVYTEFSQLETPKKTNSLYNPHQLLDFYRFSTDSITDFAKAQIDIIRNYSDKPITHNYMPNFTEVDYVKHSKLYDFISYDNYMPLKDFDHNFRAFQLDLMWSLKRNNFIIMEQQPGRINWKQRNYYYPAEHLIPATIQTFLHGAKDLLYFRYRALPYGAEQYHNGILNHHGIAEKSPRLNIVKSLSSGTKQIPPKPKSRVAIYFDYEVKWMHKINNVSRDFNYTLALMDIYNALRNAGENVDFVFSDSDIEDYEIIIVPYAYYIPDEFINKLEDYKGKLILTCMSNYKTEHNHIISDKPLGWNIKDLHFEISDFGAINKEDFDYDNTNFSGDHCIEKIDILKGRSKSNWKTGILKDNPVIIKSESGNVLYIGTVLSPDSWEKFFRMY